MPLELAVKTRGMGKLEKDEHFVGISLKNEVIKSLGIAFLPDRTRGDKGFYADLAKAIFNAGIRSYNEANPDK